MTKTCKLCGCAILIDAAPENFCSYQCQETYDAIKECEITRAGK